jgi:hypothetical protein
LDSPDVSNDHQAMHPASLARPAGARPTQRWFGLVAAAVLVAACGTSSLSPDPVATGVTTIASPATSTPAFATASSAAPGAPSATAPIGGAPTAVPSTTVWLCKPGLASNPCAAKLDTTAVDASGRASVQPLAPASDPPIDCFYVYPTVSRQKGINADLTIDPEERAVALAQAAQFSRVCDVYAPMYRQLTSAAIQKPDEISATAALTAYASVAAAFADYLANDNHGRGIVFIGHSQGAIVLDALLQYQVDPNPDVRKLLVSALLMGGNVTVPAGKLVGGDFAHIPACRSATETGCVVAYSTFDKTPPADAYFGRPSSGLNPLTGSDPNLRVLCVNPAAPGGGSGLLDPVLPASDLSSLGLVSKAATATTPFVSYPGQYRAECKSSGDLTWLQVDPAGGAADGRPVLTVHPTPEWGLHYADVNIALGNLVALVGSEAAAYR